MNAAAQNFPQTALPLLQDSQLRGSVRHATNVIQAKRLRMVSEIPDWQQLRDAGEAIRAHTLAYLGTYLEQFEQRCCPREAVSIGPAIRSERRWSSAKMIEALADVMVMKGVPEHLRSDNGPEFVARDLRKWLAGTGAKTAYIEPGSPWENGYCESFNSRLRDEFLNGEIFYSIKEIRVLAERWRVHYNTVRSHSSSVYPGMAQKMSLSSSRSSDWGPRPGGSSLGK